MSRQKLICISCEGLGEFSADDLTVGCRYEALAPVDDQGMVRVIDDSGEDYPPSYPSGRCSS